MTRNQLIKKHANSELPYRYDCRQKLQERQKRPAVHPGYGKPSAREAAETRQKLMNKYMQLASYFQHRLRATHVPVAFAGCGSSPNKQPKKGSVRMTRGPREIPFLEFQGILEFRVKYRVEATVEPLGVT